MTKVLPAIADLMKHVAARDWMGVADDLFALIKIVYPLLQPQQQTQIASRAASFGVDEPIDTAE